ncbi:hypothetical protein V8E54_014787 [Elaphomyces granulatus]
MAKAFEVMATMVIKAWNLVVKNSDKRMIVKLSAEELERDGREIADGEGDAAPFIHGYAAANGPVRTAHAPPECWDPPQVNAGGSRLGMPTGRAQAFQADDAKELPASVSGLSRLCPDTKKGEGMGDYKSTRPKLGYEKAWRPDHTSTLDLDTVNDLGILYKDQGKLDEAEKMCQRSGPGS